MSKREGDDLVRTLISAFQDTHLGTSHHSGIPFVRDETAQSHLFRIIDFLNPEIWDDPSTSAMSKEVILTLLHCAARLYEGRVHIKEAVALIENEDTRAILSLGIQGNLSQVIHQRCVESIRSNKSEAVNAENFSQQAGLFSAIRKNKARQLNHQAMIIEHISALCRSHGAALQNTFDSPRIDEPFMFRNFITLSKNLNVCERSWLVTLLPDLFEWESQEPCGEANGFNDGLPTPSLAIIKETNKGIGTDEPEAVTSSKNATSPYVISTAKQTASSSLEMPVSPDLADHLHWGWEAEACNNASNGKLVSLSSQTPVTISTELQTCTTLGTYEDIREAFNFADSSTPPMMITDIDVQHWLEKATAEEGKEVVRIYDNWTAQQQHSVSKPSTLTNGVPEFEKWANILRKRAINFRNLASVEAATSVLKAAHGFHDQATYHREENTLVGKETERDDTWGRGIQDGRVLPSGDDPDGGWDLLERDDSSEHIFPFSPPAHSDTSNRKPVALLTPRGAATHWKELHDRIASAKVRGYSNEAGLAAIPEESEAQREGEEKRVGEGGSRDNRPI